MNTSSDIFYKNTEDIQGQKLLGPTGLVFSKFSPKCLVTANIDSPSDLDSISKLLLLH